MRHARTSVLWIILSLVIGNAVCQIDHSVCIPAKFPAPPPIPILPPSFSTIIEWKLLHQNVTNIVTEYKDGINKVGSMSINMMGNVYQLLFDYGHTQYYIIVPQSGGHSCQTKSLNTQFEYFQGKFWLSPTDIWHESGIRKTMSFINNTIIRKTQASHWSSCIYLFESNTTMLLDLYFAVESWAMSLAPPAFMIPLRMEMNGKTHNGSNVHAFHAVGDYIRFDPAPDFSQQALQAPPGIFCPGRVMRKAIPQIATSFSVIMEVIDTDFKKITYETIWFDSKHKMVRKDTKLNQGDDPDPTSDLFDFNTGIKYAIDSFIGDCKATTLEQYVPFVGSDNNGKTLRMMTALEYFHMSTATVQYVGKRWARGVMCDVWVGQFLDSEVNKNVTAEWYFSEYGWTNAIGLTLESVNLLRMDVWQGGLQNAIIHNVEKFYSYTPPWSVFNIESCFNYLPLNKTHFVVKFKVINGSLTQISNAFLRNRLHEVLASRAAIDPTRITDVTLDVISNTVFYFAGILLDKATIVNNKFPPVIQHALRSAFNFLQGSIEGGWSVQITSSTGLKYKVIALGIFEVIYGNDFTTTTTRSTQRTTYLVPTLPVAGKSTKSPIITPGPVTTTSEPTPAPPAGSTKQPRPNLTTGMRTNPPSKPCTCPPQTACPKVTCPVQKGCTTPSPVTVSPCNCPNLTSTPCQPCNCPTCRSTSSPVRCPAPTPCSCAPCPKITCPTANHIPAQTRCPQITAAPAKCPTTARSLQSTDQNIGGGVSAGGAVGIALAMILVGLFIGFLATRIWHIRNPSSVYNKNLLWNINVDNEEPTFNM